MKIEYPFGTGAIRLVSTEWLAEYLNNKEMMILDVQPNIHDYIKEHIPGAIYLNEGLFRDYSIHLPTVWVERDIAGSFLSQAGIDADLPVVVYTAIGAFKGWGDGLEQTMVAYSLARYGHNKVYILDGGLDKWKEEGRPLSQIFPIVNKSDFKTAVRDEYFVTKDEFYKIKDNTNVLLLDARPPAIYEGQGPWIKPGHIPGAINLPWASLMQEKNKSLLKPLPEIQKILTEHNVRPDKIIICSCGTGREATNEFILFKNYLGYPQVKLHEGAFTEWTSDPENPTVTGKNHR